MKIEHDQNSGNVTIAVHTAELMLLRDALSYVNGYGTGGDDKEHASVGSDSCTLMIADAMYRALNNAAVRAMEYDGEPPETAYWSASEYFRAITLDDLKEKSGDVVKLVAGRDYTTLEERDQLLVEAAKQGAQKAIIDFTGHRTIRIPPAADDAT